MPPTFISIYTAIYHTFDKMATMNYSLWSEIIFAIVMNVCMYQVSIYICVFVKCFNYPARPRPGLLKIFRNT